MTWRPESLSTYAHVVWLFLESTLSFSLDSAKYGRGTFIRQGLSTSSTSFSWASLVVWYEKVRANNTIHHDKKKPVCYILYNIFFFRDSSYFSEGKNCCLWNQLWYSYVIYALDLKVWTSTPLYTSNSFQNINSLVGFHLITPLLYIPSKQI